MPDKGVDKVTDKSIDKSRQSNAFVKQKMYAALLRLLRSKAFSTISVSDLTSEAQVSRMSFYRNFNSIEDILTEHLDELIVEYQREDEKN
jgi:AcrR family transcriptional regulator